MISIDQLKPGLIVRYRDRFGREHRGEVIRIDPSRGDGAVTVRSIAPAFGSYNIRVNYIVSVEPRPRFVNRTFEDSGKGFIV